MATYMGRDTSKLKNKGGKWKYVVPQTLPRLEKDSSHGFFLFIRFEQ
jgi:hypothetical protein